MAKIFCIQKLYAKATIVFLFFFLQVHSQTDTCGSQLLKRSLHLKQTNPNEYNHLDSFRQWLQEHDKPCSSIVLNLKERISFLSDSIQYTIDTSGLSFSGKPSAPVYIVMYVSMSCPLCKRLYSELYDSITIGDLSGKAKLAVKPFGTSILDRALVASSYWGKQAELIKSVSAIKERLTLEIVLHLADSINIPLESFKMQMQKQNTISYINDSRNEAVRNGVTVTPTFFINSHRYRSYKDSRWVTDAVELIYQRLSARH